MKPVPYKGTIWFPFETEVQKLKPGQMFRKKSTDRETFTVTGTDNKGWITAVNASGTTHQLSPSYPVVELSPTFL